MNSQNSKSPKLNEFRSESTFIKFSLFVSPTKLASVPNEHNQLRSPVP